MQMLDLIAPRTPQHLSEIRTLFKEYATGLGIDLCFQNFEQELRELPGDYQKPGGALLLAYYDSQPAGCCALRPLKSDGLTNAAEMKRLFVRTAFQGKGIGRQLVLEILRTARDMRYSSVVLDTLPSMRSAHALYKKLGFIEIQSYYANPIVGAKYLMLTL